MQRKVYDATGKVVRTAEEEFVDSFGGGTFVQLLFSCLSNRTIWADEIYSSTRRINKTAD